jgi:hypothetical protein
LKLLQWLLPISGVIIGLILLTISGLSENLAIQKPVEQQPVALFVVLMMCAGGIYTAAALFCRLMPHSMRLRNWVLLLALGLRLTMLTGPPILEDDYYRYLWDGALVAHGLNPYRYAPSQILRGELPGNQSSLPQLAEQSGNILERVNYPWLRTIYPPVAQAAFGLAHRLSPWSLWAWRLVLAVFDLAALAILCRLRVSMAGLLIYGWNPLLIKEVYNSAHVDALLLPLLAIAFAAIRRGRPMAATFALGTATGIKLWPVLLMPIVWRRIICRPPLLIASITLAVTCLAVSLLPMILGGPRQTSGLTAYGRYWEMNDALYALLAWSVESLSVVFSLSHTWSPILPRLAVAAIVIAGVLWLAWRRDMAVEQQYLMAVTLMFMLSPTQFPWYYLWLLPFLAIHPHPALIFYASLLPLYYLRPLMEFYDRTQVFDYGIVWIQHGPVIAWLLWDWVVRRRRAAGMALKVSDAQGTIGRTG